MEEKRCGLIFTFLSLIGMINSFFLGFYLSTTISALSHFEERLKKIYPIHLSIVISLTTTTILLIFFGTYLFWKRNFRKGGMLGTLGGTVLLIIYIYYHLIFQPSLLNWLGPTGYLLPAFPILVGLSSRIFAKREKRSLKVKFKSQKP